MDEEGSRTDGFRIRLRWREKDRAAARVRVRPSIFTAADRNGMKAVARGCCGDGGARVIGNHLNRQISYSYRLRTRTGRTRPTWREGGAARVARGAETARDKWEFQSRLRRNRISRVPFPSRVPPPSVPPARPAHHLFFLGPRAFLIGAFDRRTDGTEGEKGEGAMTSPAHLPFSSFANR